MKKLLILSAAFVTALSVNAQPQPAEIVSKADRTTV